MPKSRHRRRKDTDPAQRRTAKQRTRLHETHCPGRAA